LHRLAQGESESLRSVLFLEEIHNLFQTTKFGKGRIDSLENIYREIRSFGQGLVSITQHCSLLPVHILGNSHTLIFLALQHQDDIEAARKALFLLRDDEVYLNMLRTGQGIVKVMERINPCLVQFLYVPVKKGVITDEWLKNMYDFSDFSGAYSTASENSDDFSGGDKIEGVKSLKSVKVLLVDILNYPLSSLVNRYRRLGINPRVGNEFKKTIVSEGLVDPKRFVTRETHVLLFELTQKGQSILRELGYEVKDNKESIEHKFWKSKIAEYYKTKGYNVLVEEHINGRPDIIVVNGSKQIAVEIETGSSNIIKNISRDLKAFDETVCVAIDKEVEEKIQQGLNENNLISAKLKLTSVLNFEIV
jgi:signal recognition particle subunit SEC65